MERATKSWLGAGPVLVSSTVLIVAFAGGCQSARPQIVPSAEASASARPTGDAEIGATDISEAIAFRKLYGLRADEDWVRDVAANPASGDALDFYGVPLLPSEFANIQHRQFDRGVLEEIRRYGNLFADEFAGAYYDSAINGVTVAFTDEVERHRSALSNLLLRDARFEVRQAPWSSRELARFFTQVRADEPWFATIGVVFGAAGRRVTEDLVYVQYEGPPEAADVILSHFGNPPWLRVEWMGPSEWTGPRADLVVIARDRGGRPIADLECAIVPQDPQVRALADGVYRTDAKGRCVFPGIAAGAYRLTLYERVGDAHRRSVAETQLTLAASGSVVPVIVPGS